MQTCLLENHALFRQLIKILNILDVAFDAKEVDVEIQRPGIVPSNTNTNLV